MKILSIAVLQLFHHDNCDTNFCFAQFWVMHATGHLHSLWNGHYHQCKVPLPESVLISVGRFRVLSRVLIRIQSSELCPSWIRVQIWVPLTSRRNPNLDWIVELSFPFFFLGEKVYFLYLSKNKVFLTGERAKPSLLCKLLIFIHWLSITINT
jgi:hypothetical protein